MSTIAGKLVAIHYFHRRAGIELPLKNPYLLQDKAGLARESALHGGGPRIRRPISWVLLKHGIGLVHGWGEGGKVLWLSLAVSCFSMCRASELFAGSNGRVHKEFCLTRGDVCFRMGNHREASPAFWRFADRVEVCFQASKGNHEPTVVSLAKTTPGRASIDWGWTGPKSSDGGQPGVGGFEVMLELMSICVDVNDNAPIAAYPQGCQWLVWKEKDATVALRAIVTRYTQAELGVPPVWRRWGCLRMAFSNKGVGKARQ